MTDQSLPEPGDGRGGADKRVSYTRFGSADFASVDWPSTPFSPESLRRRNTDKHAPAT